MRNPYLPSDVFIPDGELHLFDGRVYLYGSHDLPGGKALCEGDYVCWSAPENDLSAWRCEGVFYRRLQDPFIRRMTEQKRANGFNQYLYAPDVVCVGEHYYLYYGVGLSGSGIGVTEAASPVGPFTYLGRVRYPESARPAGWRDTQDGISDGDRALGDGVPMLQPNPLRPHFGLHMRDYPYDPAVLYDEGHLYLYFGCGYCYAAELDTRDMRTLLPRPDGRWYSGRLLPASGEKADRAAIRAQGGWHMGNGASIRKIDGRYILSYYAVRKNGCNALCYSAADSPWGLFAYQGVLVSLGNGGLHGQEKPDAYGGNTHGGMVQAGGKWYLSYHRHTGDKCPARQGCLAEMVRRPDGTFCPADFRSQVEADGGMDCFAPCPANCACILTDRRGNVRKGRTPYLALRPGENSAAAPAAGVQIVAGLSEGGTVGFRCLAFPAQRPAERVCVRMRNPAGGYADVFADEGTEKVRIARIPLSAAEGIAAFSAPVKAVSGIHTIRLQFFGQKKNAEFLSFVFSEKEP